MIDLEEMVSSNGVLNADEMIVHYLKKICDNQQKLIDLQVGANEMLKRLLMKR